MERDEKNRDLMHWQLGERMMRHPVATALTALASAAVCGGIGTIHSMGMAAVMAVAGLFAGAPLGSALAQSYEDQHVMP